MRKIATFTLSLLVIAGFVAAGASASATTANEEAVKATALDYIEGYYLGDGDRMARALHPDLAKRIIGPDGAALQEMSADDLVGVAAGGSGTRTPEDQRVMDVEILDIYDGIASVKLTARDWVDYMHIGQIDGEWKIINVLWDYTPEVKARMRR